MKLYATIEVSNRLLPSLNVKNKRPQRSFLSIGSLPGKEGSCFILLQTLSNGVGTKYKVEDNIQTVFTKFIREGKATIRFKCPPHDLIIKSDPDKLNHFLKILKNSLEGKRVNLTYLPEAPAKTFPIQKSKITISSKQDLPVSGGYPRKLEILQISNIGMKKIEGGILRLQHLKVLDLSDNELDALPPNLDLLPNIANLFLGNNNLGVGNDWRWMKSKTIQEKLTQLDLSSNKICNLPFYITRLKSLRHLDLSDNDLTSLPNGFGRLSTLRGLCLSKNTIRYLPSSFRYNHLDLFDFSMNISSISQTCSCPRDHSRLQNQEMTLVDKSAEVVLSNRLPFNDGIIPWSLEEYLENANYCICGRPVLSATMIFIIPFDMRRFTSCISSLAFSNPMIGMTFCSQRCSLPCISHNAPIVQCLY